MDIPRIVKFVAKSIFVRPFDSYQKFLDAAGKGNIPRAVDFGTKVILEERRWMQQVIDSDHSGFPTVGIALLNRLEKFGRKYLNPLLECAANLYTRHATRQVLIFYGECYIMELILILRRQAVDLMGIETAKQRMWQRTEVLSSLITETGIKKWDEEIAEHASHCYSLVGCTHNFALLLRK